MLSFWAWHVLPSVALTELWSVFCRMEGVTTSTTGVAVVQLYDTETAQSVLSSLSLEGSTAGDNVHKRGEFVEVVGKVLTSQMGPGRNARADRSKVYVST